MAAAKPPRATVVVPLVARPLVTWITATPACAHSNAAMVPAAPPPMISTSVWWYATGIWRRPRSFGLVIFSASAVVGSRLADFNECVHAGIGEAGVVYMHCQLGDLRGLELRFKSINENPVVLGALPGTFVVALKIVRAALGVLAEACKRDEHAYRAFGCVDPGREFTTELLEFLGVRAHEQVLRVILKEFARLVTLGHLPYPQVGVVDGARHDHLRKARRACASQSCLPRGIHAVDDQIGKLVRRDVDDARELARGRQPFERLAADARGVELDDLVTQTPKAFAHAIDAAGRAAK